MGDSMESISHHQPIQAQGFRAFQMARPGPLAVLRRGASGVVGRVGVEPTGLCALHSTGLRARCFDRLHTVRNKSKGKNCNPFPLLELTEGVEPPTTEYKSVVIPFNYISVFLVARARFELAVHSF